MPITVLSTMPSLVNGKVPAEQLPSYVDDVLEFANLAAFPGTGESGKIYVAIDTKKIYRWSGSAYIEIAPPPGSTDAVPEGSTNLYHTTARAAAAAPVQSVNGQTGTVTVATYTLPTATASVLGGVKIGSGISIDGNGVISASAGYTLPNATTSTLGGVIVGTGLSVSSGTVSLGTHASTHQTGGADAINPVIVTPSSLSASQNDYAPGVCDILRLSSSNDIDITGIVAPSVDGALRLIINVNSSGGKAITLKHESTSSTAANRLRNSTGGDYVLPADGGSAVLTYSSAISRWRIL